MKVSFTLITSLLTSALAVSARRTTTAAPPAPTAPAYTPPAAWNLFPTILGQSGVLLWVQITPVNATAGAAWLPFARKGCEIALSPAGKAFACALSYQSGKSALNDTLEEFALFRNFEDVQAYVTNPEVGALRTQGEGLLKSNIVTTFEFFN